MGLFDFLKKKELAKIEELKTQVEYSDSVIAELKSQIVYSDSIIAELQSQLERYRLIVDIEAEVSNQKAQLESMVNAKKIDVKASEDYLNKLDTDYKAALEVYTKLRKEINVFESKLDLIEFGVYEPVYDFEKSDEYRAEQREFIEAQKAMISMDTAAKCDTQWTVEGSEAKGKAVVRVYKKLMLRAFNGECDVLIAKVKWNNINQMKERMQKIFDAINKLGEGFKVYLDKEYFMFKEAELILEYEYQAKRQQEKEAMRAIQEELREEEKARREFEQAQREAQREEINYQKALEKARREVEVATGEKQDRLLAQILKLEQELIAAQEKKERALSMAQQTKRGHVYIISNIGSFGENVYKIGMTRRLEPEDRVKELGDASVPFQFDVHAMIYSDEARTLEYELHKAFTDRKVNMLNYRKEFFNVTLEEIEQKVKEIGFEAEFSKVPEAMEYRETQAILEKLYSQTAPITIEQMISDEFPTSLASSHSQDFLGVP